ncbi:MAG: tyrosine-type recombinase/integrase [Thermoanaerobacteraceae bacterium]|nr:tyrosine-type recombinase/integrase [Thermoanaerobacteraceae bacterium]
MQKLLKQPNRKTCVGLRDYCMILLQLDTGIRPSEMVQLLPGDVNLEARERLCQPTVGVFIVFLRTLVRLRDVHEDYIEPNWC